MPPAPSGPMISYAPRRAPEEKGMRLFGIIMRALHARSAHFRAGSRYGGCRDPQSVGDAPVRARAGSPAGPGAAEADSSRHHLAARPGGTVSRGALQPSLERLE